MGKSKTLGNRMKEYESVTDYRLIKRTPVIARIDGRAFHTFTKGLTKPFDNTLNEAIVFTASKLINDVQGCKFIYSQSDEISLLITDYDTYETDSYFDYRIQKMSSILSSSATLYFNRYINEQVITKKIVDDKTLDLVKLWQQKTNKAMFDARVFNLDKEEVCNYFIWRQQDAIRNSVEALARSQFTQRELHKKNILEMKEMLISKGIIWEEKPLLQQRGFSVYKEPSCYINDDTLKVVINISPNYKVDYEIPIFQDNRNYIEQFLI